MVNDIRNMHAAVGEFAARHDMTIVPAVPGADSGRTVVLDPGILDLPGFLELARKLGDGALYLRTERFGLDPDTGQSEDVPAHLARHRGQTCELRVAFASSGHGLLHFWDQAAPWYREWVDSQEADLLNCADEDMRATAEEQSRLAGELAESILADSEFLASSSPPRRRRRAQLLIPEGTDRHVAWDAVEKALKLAEERSEQAYRPIWDRLSDLAAEFLASPGWKQAASADARKKGAEQFLISLADGFCPPPLIRNELYARTRDLFKDAGGRGLFLSVRTSKPASARAGTP